MSTIQVTIDKEEATRRAAEVGVKPELMIERMASDERSRIVKNFFEAIRHGGIEAVRAGLDQGVDPNRCYRLYGAALVGAISYEQEEIADLLIDRGAKGSQRDEDDRSAIFIAARSKQMKIFDRLLEQVEDVTVQKLPHPPLLHEIAMSGNIMAAAKVLARGAEINLVDERYSNGTAALHYITGRDLGHMTEFLLASGADVNIRSGDGKTALISAMGNNERFDEIAVLLDYTDNVNAQDRYGKTALHWALRPEIVSLLLNRGADPMIADNKGKTALDNLREDSPVSHSDYFTKSCMTASIKILERAMAAKEAGYKYSDLHFRHLDGTCLRLAHATRLSLAGGRDERS